MVDNTVGEHRPIQTSAVIVLGAAKGPSQPPPSPPTPYATPSDSTILCREPSDSFTLTDEHENQYNQTEPSGGAHTSADEAARTKDKRLRSGIHVINTEALGLASLTKLYETDATARSGFHCALDAITRQAASRGKLVIIGVGKSGHIGKKLVATFQSLDIRAVFLHPTEALHGDLGIVGPDDVLLFITYSGSTQELLAVLPHLDESLPTILLTSHTRADACEFMKRRPQTILLPAPVHEPERVSFGVAAPSTSTTAALALGDALAITAAHELHPSAAAAFAKNHPGGAIGAAAVVAVSKCRTQTLRNISIPWEDIHDATSTLSNASAPAIGLLRAGYESKTGWVRVGDGIAAPSKIRSLTDSQLRGTIGALDGVFVSRHDMLAMSAETTVRQARDILQSTHEQSHDDQGSKTVVCEDSVIAVTGKGCIYGVAEVGSILDSEDER
jgi:D-arabinose 5-phosphate isomerase GutQ